MQGSGFKLVTLLVLVLIVEGVLELVADYQLQTFRVNCQDRSALFREGLWRHSRHPNYLEEITVWWGVYLVLLSCCPDLWFLGVGAMVNTCLFLFISIPMAEKHLATYKQDDAADKAQTRMLLPIPRRR